MYYPEARIDGVELDPAVSAVGRRYFGLDDNPRLTVHTADARPFLRRHDARYDLIFVDAYRQPYVPFYLATREFFRLCRERLAPGGVVALNVSTVPGDDRLAKAVAGTLRAEFPQVITWQALRFNQFVVGSRQPLPRAVATAPVHGARATSCPSHASSPATCGRPSARRIGPGPTTARPVEWITDRMIASYARRALATPGAPSADGARLTGADRLLAGRRLAVRGTPSRKLSGHMQSGAMTAARRTQSREARMEDKPQFRVDYEATTDEVGVVILEGEIDIYSAPEFKEVLVNGIEGGAKRVDHRSVRGHVHRLDGARGPRERREACAAPQRQPGHRLYGREHHPDLRDHRPRSHLRRPSLTRRGSEGSGSLIGKVVRGPAGGSRRLSRGPPEGREHMENRTTTVLRGRRLHSAANGAAKTTHVRSRPDLHRRGMRNPPFRVQSLVRAPAPSTTGSGRETYLAPQCAEADAARGGDAACSFERCGREFTSANPARRYCSDACRMRAFQARVMESRRMSDDVTVRRAS